MITIEEEHAGTSQGVRKASGGSLTLASLDRKVGAHEDMLTCERWSCACECHDVLIF